MLRRITFYPLFLTILFFASCQEKKYVSPEVARKKFLASYEKHLTKITPRFALLHGIHSEKLHDFVGVKVMVQGEYRKEEALKLFKQFADDFFTFAKNYKDADFFPPFKLQSGESTELTLTFWTEEMDRPQAEFAAEIQLNAGNVTYYHKQVGNEFLDINNSTIFGFYELD